MDLLLFVLLTVITGIIVYQDFCFREITWVLLALLAIIIFISTFIDRGFRQVIIYTMTNSAFILTTILFVQIYYLMKNKKVSFIINQYIGWGDILFLFAIAPAFSLPLFIIYFVTGMGLTLIVFIFIYFTRHIQLKSYPVPLAGILAIYLIVMKGMLWLDPEIAKKVETLILASM